MIRNDGVVVADSVHVNDDLAVINSDGEVDCTKLVAQEASMQTLNTFNATITNQTTTKSLQVNNNTTLGTDDVASTTNVKGDLKVRDSITVEPVSTQTGTVQLLKINNGGTTTASIQADGSINGNNMSASGVLSGHSLNINNSAASISSVGAIKGHTLNIDDTSATSILTLGGISVAKNATVNGNLTTTNITAQSETITGTQTVNGDFTLGTVGTTSGILNGDVKYTGPIVDGSNLITKDYVDSLEIGLIWIPPVKGIVETLPSNPADGDGYIYVGSAGMYVPNSVYRWSALLESWNETPAKVGLTTINEENNNTYSFIVDTTGDSSWQMIGLGGTNNHFDLLNIGTNTHVDIDEHIANSTTAHFGQDLTTLGTPTFSALTCPNISGQVVELDMEEVGFVFRIVSKSVDSRDITMTNNGAIRARTVDLTGLNNGYLGTNTLEIYSAPGEVSGKWEPSGKLTATSLVITDATASTSISTGCATFSGGIGVAGNSYLGGIIHLTNPEDATSTSTGALQVDGGVSIKKGLYVTGNSTFGDEPTTDTLTINALSTITGNLTLNNPVGLNNALTIQDAGATTGTWTNDGTLETTRMKCNTAPTVANDVIRLADLGGIAPSTFTTTVNINRSAVKYYDGNGASISFTPSSSYTWTLTFSRVQYIIACQIDAFKIEVPLYTDKIVCNNTAISDLYRPTKTMRCPLIAFCGLPVGNTKGFLFCKVALTNNGQFEVETQSSIDISNPTTKVASNGIQYNTFQTNGIGFTYQRTS